MSRGKHSRFARPRSDGHLEHAAPNVDEAGVLEHGADSRGDSEVCSIPSHHRKGGVEKVHQRGIRGRIRYAWHGGIVDLNMTHMIKVLELDPTARF